MEEEFDKYVANYDMNDKDIKLKYNHSYRVMELQEKYAKLLKWSKEDIELAKIIGLLHDIGRFEQLRLYHTYDDLISIDHANYSIERLFKYNEIERFCKNKVWYPIIEFAIKNHNKFVIEDEDDINKLKHAKLIRDTDKVDILYLMGKLKETGSVHDSSAISPLVREMIGKNKTVSREMMITRNDHFVNKLAFAYDINYDCVLEEIKRNIGYFYESIKDNKDLLDIYNIVNEYIDNRMNESGIKYVR